MRARQRKKIKRFLMGIETRTVEINRMLWEIEEILLIDEEVQKPKNHQPRDRDGRFVAEPERH